MGKIKINADLFDAKVRKTSSFESLKDKYGSSADMLLDVLNSCGSNVRAFYHAPPSGSLSSGEGNLAYMLDNYYEHAIKFPGCDTSIMQLLQGIIAIVFIESNNPLGGHWFDIWNGQGLSFTDQTTLAEFGGKRVWVWTMGQAAKAKAKHHGHTKHHAVHIF